MKPGCIITRAYREHSIECCLFLIRPGTGSHAGSDQQAIERDLAPISQLHLPVGQIERCSSGAQQPFSLDILPPGQGSMLIRDPSGEDGFGQGGTVIGFIGFITNEGQMARKAFRSQSLRGAQTGQGGANDHDMAIGGAVRERGGAAHHGLAPGCCGWETVSGCSSRSSRVMAWTGQAAAAHLTCSRIWSSGAQSYSRASSPWKRKTLGARKTHCP